MSGEALVGALHVASRAQAVVHAAEFQVHLHEDVVQHQERALLAGALLHGLRGDVLRDDAVLDLKAETCSVWALTEETETDRT